MRKVGAGYRASLRPQDGGDGHSIAVQGHELRNKDPFLWMDVHDRADVARPQLFPFIPIDIGSEHKLLMFAEHPLTCSPTPNSCNRSRKLRHPTASHRPYEKKRGWIPASSGMTERRLRRAKMPAEVLEST